MKAIRISIVASMIAVAFASPFVSAQRGRPAWPKAREGVYIATSSQTIPPFPRVLPGYRPTSNTDYWGERLPPNILQGSVRVGQSGEWEEIYQFPMSMNGCSAGTFTLRWRSADPKIRIESALGYHYTGVIFARKTGVFGYMQGHNCEEPMFKFGGTTYAGGSNIVDVYYEVKFWRAAP